MPRPRISRRDFARTVGVAAGVALLPKSTRADQPAKASPPASPPSKLPPTSQAEADARLQTILARYGTRLSPAERADLARLCHDAQEQLDKLRAYPLDVADEPAHVFRAPRRRH